MCVGFIGLFSDDRYTYIFIGLFSEVVCI